MSNIKWSKYIPHSPTQKQYEALKNNAKELLYGGALGGGKSDYLLMCGLQYADIPGYASAVFRRSLSDLKLPGALLDRARDWLQPHMKTKQSPANDVTYVGSEHTYYFKTRNPDGSIGIPARLCFCYIGDANAKDRYQSSEFQTIGFDELSQWDTMADYKFMSTRLRKTVCKKHGKKPNGDANYVKGCPECDLKKIIPTRLRAACVDKGDVLTLRGWIDIKDVTEEDKVASINPLTGVTEYKSVLWVYAGKNDKKMIQVDKKNLKCSFTEDHRIVYTKSQGGDISIDPWNEIKTKTTDMLRHGTPLRRVSSIFSIPCGIKRQTFIKFLGLYLSDGSVNHKPQRGNYKVIITQLKSSKEKVKKILDDMPFNYCRCSNGDYQITNKELWSWFIKLGYAKDKYVPQEVMNCLSTKELKSLLKYLVIGDGHVRNENIQYTTTSKFLADNICELGVLLGYKVQLNRRSLKNEKHNDKFELYLTRKKNNTTRIDRNPEDRDDCTEYNYNGMVYCIKVEDNSNFIIRQNGYVWVSGNTNPGGRGGRALMNHFHIVPDPKKYPDKRAAILDIMKDIKVNFVSTHPKRAFIPAFIDDNPHLDQTDYDEFLNDLDPLLRSQLRDGNWLARADSRFKRSDARYYKLYENAYSYGGVMRPFSEFEKIFITVDPAGTVREGIVDQEFSLAKNKSKSYTVISVWGKTADNSLFWLDMVRFRDEIPVVVEQIEKVYKKWKPEFVKIEVNGIGLGVGQYVAKLGIPVSKTQKGSDKLENSTAAQLLMKSGKIYFPDNASWIDECEDEVFQWTGLPSEQDDIVDTLSDAAQVIGPINVDSEDEDAEDNYVMKLGSYGQRNYTSTLDTSSPISNRIKSL